MESPAPDFPETTTRIRAAVDKRILKTRVVERVKTGRRAPYMNAYSERLVRNIQCERLPQMIVFGAVMLRRLWPIASLTTQEQGAAPFASHTVPRSTPRIWHWQAGCRQPAQLHTL